MFCARWLGIVVVLSIVEASSLAQTGPLGDIVRMPLPIDPGPRTRRVLPAGAAVLSRVRVDERSMLVVFNSGTPPLSRPHVALLDGEKLVWSEDLSKRDEYLETYAFTGAQVTNCPSGSVMYTATFRNLGDGSGIVFVTVSKASDKWGISFLKRFQQARLDVLNCGSEFSVKYAVPRDECTWCAHRYEVQRFVFDRGVGRYVISGAPSRVVKLLPKSVMR